MWIRSGWRPSLTQLEGKNTHFLGASIFCFSCKYLVGFLVKVDLKMILGVVAQLFTGEIDFYTQKIR